LGKARTLEARNELARAIEQYQLVTKNWPDTPEAAEAQELLQALQKPEAAAFYKELYAYSPTKVTLPSEATEKFDFPPPGGSARSTNPGSATKTGSTPPPELPLELAPPRVREVPAARPKEKRDTKPAGAKRELPADVFGK
jgi:hypothetical protein